VAGIFDLVNRTRVDSGIVEAQVPSTTFTDVVGASFEATRDNYNSNSTSYLRQKFTQERDDNYKSAVGRDIYQDALSLLEDGSQEAIADPRTGTLRRESPEMIKAVDTLLEQTKVSLPDSASGMWLSGEVNERAKSKARSSLKNLEKVSAGATGFSAFSGGLAGGIGAGFTDPINLATLPFGAASSYGIIKTALMEAAINAASEVAIQPFVAEWQNEIGNTYGFKQAAENVGMAALFGAGIGGLARGVAKGLEKISVPEISHQAIFYDMSEKFKRQGNFEAADAARVMARKIDVDDADVGKFLNDVAVMEKHVEALGELEIALREGRNLDPEKIRITNDELAAINPDSLKSPKARADVKLIQEPAIEKTSTKESNPMVEQPRAEKVMLGKQKEIEATLNSEAAVMDDTQKFLETHKDEDIIVGDSVTDDLTVASIKKEIEDNTAFRNILRTCSL